MANRKCLYFASISIAVVTLLLQPSYAKTPAPNIAAVDDSQWIGGPTKDWFVNWDKALAEAKRTGKPMFILLTGSDWCSLCIELKKKVIDTPEFAEIVKDKVVLVYLDNPRNSLAKSFPKSQMDHNRLITRLFEGGSIGQDGSIGVPYAFLVTDYGLKIGRLGSMCGDVETADAWLKKLGEFIDQSDRLRKTIEESFPKLKNLDKDLMRLFTEGYPVLAAEDAAGRAEREARRAARIAALPPVNKSEFKAKLTGVAVVDPPTRPALSAEEAASIAFLPPDEHIIVPDGKFVLFRVEYDFPEGRDPLCDGLVDILHESFDYAGKHFDHDGKNFRCDGTLCSLVPHRGLLPGFHRGKGVAYLDMRIALLSEWRQGWREWRHVDFKECKLKRVAIWTIAQPATERWKIDSFPVDVVFMGQLQSSDDGNESAKDADSSDKDDRFFFAASERSKIAKREIQRRRDNAKSEFELNSFAGIQFGIGKEDGVPTLDRPYRLLSIVNKASYSGGKLSGLTLAAPVKDVKALSEDALREETCLLTQSIEDDLGIKFAVTGSKIDFIGKRTSIVVTSNKSSGTLSVQLTKKK